MNRFFVLSLLPSLVLIFWAAQLPADERRPVSIDDLYLFDAPSDVVIAPDGESAVYIRRWNERASRTTRYSLWRSVGDADHAAPLEEGEPDARRPLLSPDGEWIVFLSTRDFPDGTPAFDPVPPYSDAATDIWLIPTAGGRAIPLAGPDKPYGRVFNDGFYGGVAFSPDGSQLVFVADDGPQQRMPEEIENNVQIVREDQGEGYDGYTAAQIWIADLSALAEDPDAGVDGGLICGESVIGCEPSADSHNSNGGTSQC